MNAESQSAGFRLDELEQIIEMTRAMLAKAQAQEWAEVMKMELERQGRLQALFAAEVPDGARDRVVEAIREILEMDQEIIALGQRGQQALLQSLNELQTGRRAQEAYAACSG